MKISQALLFFVLSFVVVSVSAWDLDEDEHDHEHDHEEEQSNEDFSVVTCGSTLKLSHKATSYRLHSHAIKWGSGSQQQSVTAAPQAGDPNSFWQVREPYNTDEKCVIGQPIKCGDKIRLFHVTTRHWLHSHLHTAPISGRQEVSAYGEGGASAASDTGDNWKLECANPEDKEWKRDQTVSLVHVDTGRRLFSAKNSGFDNNNCRGCPIIGQLEVSCADTRLGDVNAQWQAEHGLYFPKRKEQQKTAEE